MTRHGVLQASAGSVAAAKFVDGLLDRKRSAKPWKTRLRCIRLLGQPAATAEVLSD